MNSQPWKKNGDRSKGKFRRVCLGGKIPCRASCFSSVDFFQIDRGQVRQGIEQILPPNRLDDFALASVSILLLCSQPFTVRYSTSEVRFSPLIPMEHKQMYSCIHSYILYTCTVQYVWRNPRGAPILYEVGRRQQLIIQKQNYHNYQA